MFRFRFRMIDNNSSNPDQEEKDNNEELNKEDYQKFQNFI